MAPSAHICACWCSSTGERSSAWLIMMKRAYTAYTYLKELGGDWGDTFAHGIPIGLMVT